MRTRKNITISLGLVLIICLVGCSSVFLPLSDSKPTILAFCNNTNVSCSDYSITRELERRFDANVEIVYVFIDSDTGKRIFDYVGLSNIPSYLLFNSDKTEIFRLENSIDIEILYDQIYDLFEVTDN